MMFEVHLKIHTASLEKQERWGGVKETFQVEGTAPESHKPGNQGKHERHWCTKDRLGREKDGEGLSQSRRHRVWWSGRTGGEPLEENCHLGKISQLTP